MRIEKTPANYEGEPIPCPECGGFLVWKHSHRADCRVCGKRHSGEGSHPVKLTFHVERVSDQWREEQAILPCP